MCFVTTADDVRIFYKDWGSSTRVTASWPTTVAVKLLKQGTLKVYKRFPLGMCTTHADAINPDLLAFIRA